MILWESKRTKTWSDGWITKLKDDQRAAKADVAIIGFPEHSVDMSLMHFDDKPEDGVA